jgi:hypothetical protein
MKRPVPNKRAAKITNPHGNGELHPVVPGERRGRKPGVPNRMTRVLKELILMAAEHIGRPQIIRDDDGKITECIATGEDGTLGYLVHLGLTEPRVFGGLLRAVLPLQIVARVDENIREVDYQTPEEIRDELLRQGIPEVFLPKLIPSPKDVVS